jgi:hypothetical protein
MNFLQTSITPRQPYTDRMTNAAVNQGIAQADQQNNIYSMFKQLPQNNGTSRGPADWARLTAPLAQARAQQNSFAAGQRLGDLNTNAQSQLQGEQAREGESFGLAGLLQNNAQRDMQYNNQRQSQLMQMFQGLLGGVG